MTALEVTLRGGPAEIEAVLSALAALPGPLIAADWAGGEVVDLADSGAIARFAARAR